MPGTVLLPCWLFVFWCISIISRSEKQPFCIIVLNWSSSLWLVAWKLKHSCQIFIILFLYPHGVGQLLKMQCNASWLCSQVQGFRLCLWLVWFLKSSFVYLKKVQPKFADWRRLSHVSYKESICRSWHPSLLPGSHVVWDLDLTFLSWVVYFGYTRHRACLLSAHLIQMWPRSVTVTVHEQRVTKKKKKKKPKF